MCARALSNGAKKKKDNKSFFRRVLCSFDRAHSLTTPQPRLLPASAHHRAIGGEGGVRGGPGTMLQCSHLGGLRIEVSTHGAASAWGGRNDGAVVFAPGHAAVVTSKSFGACLNEWTSGYHAS